MSPDWNPPDPVSEFRPSLTHSDRAFGGDVKLFELLNTRLFKIPYRTLHHGIPSQ